MKRDFDIIKTNETDAMLGMQDEDARKLLASRERLLALNAIFDAALMGESAKHIAKGIDSASQDMGDHFMKHLLDEESATEH